MDNLFLDSEKFSHRLNMSGFTNIEKSYTTTEFNSAFGADEFFVLEKAGIDAFIAKVSDAVGGTIVKGGFNDTPEVNNLIEKAKNDLKSLSRILINDGPGTERVVYVMEKAKVVETLEKGESGDELEKSHIDAFEYSDKIVFKKSGKDIKEKFAAAKVEEQAENERYAKEIEDALEKCTMTPSEKPSLWGTREMITVPYKVFNWNQTYYSTDGGNVYDTSESEESCRACNTPEEAECNRMYNNAVYKWIDSCVELKTIDLYANNLDDKETYELTARQMLALKF
jgi:hypothetical protein